jgi:phosphoglycolate phosphatase-like HAD superfamily hydrolase
MRPVILFDIDGTLVTGPQDGTSAGVKAMNRASLQVAGRETYFGTADYAGRTDLQIARLLIIEAGDKNPPRQQVEKLVEYYLKFLAEEIIDTPYKVLGNPREAVTALRAGHMKVGLGTGNVRRGARLKLQNVGIGDLFDFENGGFGEDGETRAELLRHGARRLDPTQNQPVIIIGDTPRDVEGAHAIGAFCIGMPYRHNSKSVLLEAGADAIAHTIDGSLVEIVDTLLTEESHGR